MREATCDDATTIVKAMNIVAKRPKVVGRGGEFAVYAVAGTHDGEEGPPFAKESPDGFKGVLPSVRSGHRGPPLVVYAPWKGSKIMDQAGVAVAIVPFVVHRWTFHSSVATQRHWR